MVADGEPQLRADAQRNRDAVLRSGQRLLERDGAEFSLEEAARLAGVGKGTLYRHFPTRDELIAAVLAQRFTELADEAEARRAASDAGEAVREWLRSFDRLPLRYRGLSARLGTALGDDGSAVATACAPMKERFTELLERAQAQGAVRTDVRASELLSVIASLPQQIAEPDGRGRILDLILRGLAP